MEKYYEGTKFKLITTYDGQEKDQEYMLCEVQEEEFVFQIICISGYNSGKLVGYVKKQPNIGSHKAIDLQFFKQEIKRNFLFKPNSFRIIEEKNIEF